MPFCPAFLIAAANAFCGLGDESAGHPGRTVELMLGQVRQPPGAPWDVAFVYHVGYWSHYDNAADHSTWPLPPTARAHDLGVFAYQRNVLVKRPQRGDVFLLYSMIRNEFANAGIVVRVLHDGTYPSGQPYIRCVTIQGDTGTLGAPAGRRTHRVIRDFCPANGDRFIRWTDLDPRTAFGDIRVDVDIVEGRMAVRRAA